jgi:1-acyl-sn-glycerol-3-phosphate acyltransferase
MLVLRSLLFWSFLVPWTFLTVLPHALLSILSFGLFRHRLMESAMACWAIPALWVAGVRLRVRGREHLRGGGARIIVMNHQSLLDMLCLSALHPPGACPLGKSQFKWVPVIGLAWWALGGHFVDRGNSPRARATLRKLGDDMRRHGLAAIIAPEGTRTRTGQLQPFKMGAFHLAHDLGGVPIVPLIWYGAWDLCRPDDWRVRPGVVDVVVHPPIDTSGWSRESLRAEAQALHDWYEARIAEGPGP